MAVEPDSSAVRIALWRALHVEVDAPPHVLEDEVGLALVDPEPGWRERPDMDPVRTAGNRAGIVARTRYVEDLVRGGGFGQYVLLGAGVDTFAQRHPEVADRVDVFEVDQPATQQWKRHRLRELGYDTGGHPRFVPVDFEADGDWWSALLGAGLDPAAPTLVSSSGVSMYISEEATTATLRRLSSLGAGSLVVMTFIFPFELVDPAERPALEGAARGARASGTPWISLYAPDRIAGLAREAGFDDVRCVPTATIAEPYLAGRPDGLRASSGEGVLLART